MKGRQTGAATLFITIIILALLTVIAAVSAKIGMFELKTSANSNRAKEALHAAQGGLDFGAVNYLKDASWAGASLLLPYGGPGASVSVSAVTGTNSVVLNAMGGSVDTAGLARVEERFSRVPILDVGELPPLMANGNFPDSGSFSIITNPDGGGPGVPVSGWTEDATKQGNSSWQTCNVDEWLYEGTNMSKAKLEQSDGFILCHTCSCSQADNPICDPKDKSIGETYDCPDVVVTPGTVPDAFTQLFGIAPEDSNVPPATSNGVDDWYEFMQAFAKTDVTCASLNASVGDRFYSGGADYGDIPLIWIDGDCSIPAGSVASYDHPVILFVHGNLTMNSNTKFYGILFGFSDRYGASPAPNNENFSVKVNGGPTLYGVLLSNQDLDQANGGFSLVYSKQLLEKLTHGGGTLYDLARYPGSWTDTK